MTAREPFRNAEIGGSLSPIPLTFFSIATPPASLPRGRLNSVLSVVLDFWLAAAVAGPPPRSAVDPIALRRVLGHLILWDVLPDDGGYRCRLAGTEICAAAERELRGCTLEEMHGIGSPTVRAEFDLVRDTGEAHLVERTMHWVARPHRLYKRLLLPLADREGNIDALLGAITIH